MIVLFLWEFSVSWETITIISHFCLDLRNNRKQCALLMPYNVFQFNWNMGICVGRNLSRMSTLSQRRVLGGRVCLSCNNDMQSWRASCLPTRHSSHLYTNPLSAVINIDIMLTYAATSPHPFMVKVYPNNSQRLKPDKYFTCFVEISFWRKPVGNDKW